MPPGLDFGIRGSVWVPRARFRPPGLDLDLLGSPGLDLDILGTPVLDLACLGPPGLDFVILEPPGLDLVLLGPPSKIPGCEVLKVWNCRRFQAVGC